MHKQDDEIYNYTSEQNITYTENHKNARNHVQCMNAFYLNGWKAYFSDMIFPRETKYTDDLQSNNQINSFLFFLGKGKLNR